MKIVFLNSHPIAYFSDLYKFLSKSGINFEVWYCSKYGIKKHYDKEFNSYRVTKDLTNGFKFKFLYNFKLNSTGEEKLLDTLNPFLFFDLLSLKRGDIIICHGWSRITMLFTIFFSRVFGLKVGLRAETPIIHEKNYHGFKRKIRKIFLQLVFKKIDYFFYIGTYNKQFYKSFGISDNQLISMPYSVKPKKVPFKLNIKRKNKILFCGKLINKKRPLDLLKAYCLLKDPKLEINFAGDGCQRYLLEKFSIENKIANKINFLGLLSFEKLDEIYNQSDCIVLPSGYGETWGLVLNEALEHSLPIIVSDMVGGSIDLCQNNGYIFEYSNVQDLANKIKDLYNANDYDFEIMRKNSFKIKEKFSFSEILNNLNKFLINA